MSFDLPSYMKPRTGYFCRTPVIFEWQGEAMQRPCGHCGRCVAAKMRDLTARAAAEAFTSDEVVVFTLTYRPGEAGAFKWVTPDRQKFQKRIRKRLYDDARRRVGAPSRLRGAAGDVWRAKISAACVQARFFGCGERGSRGTKRLHWHVVAFFAGGDGSPSGWQSSPRDRDGKMIGEDRTIWPHGISTVHVLPVEMPDRIRAVRYVSKYLAKSVQGGEVKKHGGTPDAVMFRSLKPALGAAYLAGWAKDHAEAGLSLPGWFKVPNLRFSRGRKSLVENVLHGVSRDLVIAAYRDAWAGRYGDKPYPASEFIKRYDEQWAMPVTGKRLAWRRRAANLPAPPRPAPDHCRGTLVVHRQGRVAGVVSTLRNGVAIWTPVGGKSVILETPDMLALLGIDLAGQDAVAAWIQDRRGDGWQSPRERFEQVQDQRVARLRALLKGCPQGDVIPGRLGVRALTGVYRRLRLAGQVDAKGEPVRREYRPPKDADALLRRDDFQVEVMPVKVVNVLRAGADGSLHWEGKPRFMMRTP